MSITTSDLSLNPADGWVLVATNPRALIIRSKDGRPFQVAVLDSPGDPAETESFVFNRYFQIYDGHVFEKMTPSVGSFYVKALRDGPQGENTQMGIFSDIVLSVTVTVDSTIITVDTTLVTCDEA